MIVLCLAINAPILIENTPNNLLHIYNWDCIIYLIKSLEKCIMIMTRSKSEEKQTANQQLVKESNLSLIFNFIKKYESISRAELANITKLSPTTVSSLAEELLRDGYIVEAGSGSSTTSGRKAIMLQINSNGGYVVSIEIVPNYLKCFLYDLNCREAGGCDFSISDYNSVGKQIVDAVQRVMEEFKLTKDKLLGICIGVPGLIDSKNRHVISSTVVPIDEKNHFLSFVKNKFTDIHVMLGNESCFYAYAEKEFGTGKDVKNLIFIDINVGIGAGIILNGEIFTGSNGLAGEIGHTTIDINGTKCKCGNRGCLELLASIPAISQKIIMGMMSGRDTKIQKIIGFDYSKINANVIRQGIDNKDELVLQVIDDVAQKLAYGINNIINLFNPEVIVIGGEIVKLGEVFLEKIKLYLNEIALKPNIDKVEVYYSRNIENASTMGGAAYVLDNIFKTGAWEDKGLMNR